MRRSWLGKILGGAALIFGAGLLWALGAAAGLDPAEVVFDNFAEVQTLDPATANGQPENRVLMFLFEGLTVAHPKTLEPLPGVAASWVISKDWKTFRFHLRGNARWTNGDRVTSTDFRDSWLRLLHPRTGSPYAYLLYGVVNGEAYGKGEIEDPDLVGLEAPDPSTFIVRLEKPIPYFLELTYYFPLFPIHLPTLETFQENYPDTWPFEWIKPENIVTNGPYRILDRRINNRIRFEKSPVYWDQENVAVRTVDALVLEGAGTRLNLFETGGLHWTQSPPATIVPDLMQRDRAGKERLFRNEPFLSIYLYYFNVTRPPLDDRRVREALAISIDKERITRFVTRAGQVPAVSLIPPGIPGYRQARAPSFDPERARKLLAEAGFPKGKGLPPMDILYNTAELHRDVAEVIQDEWQRNLGVEIRLVNQEWKTYLDAQLNHEYWISRGSWIADYRDPMTFLDIYLTGNGNNRSGFSDPDFDDLINRASLEPDPAKRMNLLHEAESILMRELPCIPLYYYVGSNLVRPELKGWEHNALDMHFPKFWRLEK